MPVVWAHRAVRHSGKVRGPTLHRYGEQLQGELRWKGMVIGASEGTEVKAIADNG